MEKSKSLKLIELVDKLTQSPDTQESTIRMIHSFLISKFCGDGFIEPFVNDLVTNISKIAIDFPSRRLHDTALSIICLISISCLDDVEDPFSVFEKEMMLHFNEIKNGQSFRFYTIAIVAAFSINDEELCSKILRSFLEIAQNKHPKACKFSPQTVCEIFTGIALMLSMFPESVCAQTFTEEIMKAIDTGLQSSITEICFAAMNVLAVMYENVSNYTPENSDPFMEKSTFVAKYEPRLATIGDRINSKQEKKLVQSRAAEIIALFDNRNTPEKMTINQQIVKIETPSNGVIIEAVKRLTGKYFPQQIGANERIQEIIGIKLLSTKEAREMKKEHRDDLDRGREMTKKEREMQRNDKRRKKEAESGLFDQI